MNQEKINKLLERIGKGQEYRTVVEFRAGEQENTVEGYACTFMQPYTLIRWDDYEVREQIDPHAFDGCDMSDVIFQYDHAGRVMARTRNGTLTVSVDAHGLKTVADLSGSALGPGLYQDIKGGYIDRMSFRFAVAEDKREITEDREHNKTTVLRTITKISKLYDVSAVSIPANDGTDISARSYLDGVIKELEAERLRAEERERARKALALRTRIFEQE